LTVRKTSKDNPHSGVYEFDTLSPQQHYIIWKIRRSLDEVCRRSMAEWLHYFREGQSPEHNLEAWEAMSLAYSSFTKGRNFTLKAKDELFELAQDMMTWRSEKYVLQKSLLEITPYERGQFLMAFSWACSWVAGETWEHESKSIQECNSEMLDQNGASEKESTTLGNAEEGSMAQRPKKPWVLSTKEKRRRVHRTSTWEDVRQFRTKSRELIKLFIKSINDSIKK